MNSPLLIDLPFLERLVNSSNGPTDYAGDSESSSDYDTNLLRLAVETVLLKQTLDYVHRSVPYYRDRMHELSFSPSDFNSVSDFLSFPLLTRSDLVENRSRLIAENCNIVSVRSTSGTSGQSIPIFFSDKDEQCFQLIRKIRSGGIESSSLPDIILDVKPAAQRLISGSATGNFTLSAIYNIDGPPLFRMDVSYEEFIIQQLFEHFPVPNRAGHVTALRCMPPFLLWRLTKAMLDRGIDPKQSHVKDIYLAGGHPPEGLRRLIAESWDAQLHSSFSCAEVNGFARNCVLKPHRYHFDPTLFVEVLDVVEHVQVNEGEEGLLVLTSLYPFQQAQPFIRYVLGDIVRFCGYHCECGSVGPAIEFRGRLGQCVPLPSTADNGSCRYFLGTAEIEDALSMVREVPSEFYPHFKLSSTETHITVDVEVVWRISLEWEREVARRIERNIKNRLKSLKIKSALPLKVNLHNRGQLKDYCRLYPAR